jgi:Family of unknown function (DUF6603)
MPSTSILEIELTIGEQGNPLTFVTENDRLGVRIGERLFSLGKLSRLKENKRDISTDFVAVYHKDGGDELNIHDLVAHVSGDIAELISKDLSINLEDALFAFNTDGDQTGFLLGLHVGTDIDLSNLPLVGRKLPDDQTISVTGLQLVAASRDFTAASVKQINAAIADIASAADAQGLIKLPEAPLSRGCSVLATLKLGDSPSVVQVPITVESGGEESPQATGGGLTASTTSTSAGSPAKQSGSAALDAPKKKSSLSVTKWFSVHKTLGPAHFEKIGLQYENRALWFLLDASLTAAGLTISLDGLGVGSELRRFSPQFKLQGLGIDYDGGGVVEIGGAFLKIAGSDGQPDIFNGSAIIKTKAATISGLGSYAELRGHPSLFVYAFLNYPLGGPAFFFVTGLAAGFGYNRKLIVPAIEEVINFPLVREALGLDKPKDLEAELGRLQDYVPPTIGEAFLAVGVRFTTFKLIDSFALLTIEFGSRVVFNILGLSTAIVPTPEAGKNVTPLAEVQMAWKATFDPDEGFLGLSAQLTANSYILSHDCHLTGGFAFYSWFAGEHAGDFVQTMGGYHPAFNVPAHYPSVPRLQFNWRVTSNLTLKGDAYYALCGSALMAGGHLDATWESGDLKAWFKAGADFLIQWKPYHYDASIYVDVGVSYTFKINLLFTSIRVTISVDVGADLHIWGPDFSGHARVHLWIITFGISFGADASQEPLPINWTTFKTSFLPAPVQRDGKSEENICSISVKDGLVREMREDAGRWIINPKHFSLITSSAIPFTVVTIKNTNDVLVDRIYYGEDGARKEIRPFGKATGQDKWEKIASIAIGSMDGKADQLTSTYTIEITRDSKTNHVESDFLYQPILKKVPSGLWGESREPDLNGEHFIENALTGFEITPKQEPKPVETAAIGKDKLQFSTTSLSAAYSLEQFKGFVASADSSTRIDDINKSNPKRDMLLKSMGYKKPDETVKFERMDSKVFLVTPRIGKFAE